MTLKVPTPTDLDWREVLSAAQRSTVRGKSAGRPLRYGIDVLSTSEGRAFVVRLFDAEGRPIAGRRPVLHGDDVRIVGALFALAEALRREDSLAFELPARAARDLLPELCAGGRAHVVAGETAACKRAIRWENEPYALALEAVAHEDGDFELRSFLRRGSERLDAREPSLLLPGAVALWLDRAALVDDFDQYEWIAAARAGRRVRVTPRELDDLVDALHVAPRSPELALPPAHALDEARLTPRPYACLWKKGQDWVRVSAGLDYSGLRIPIDKPGRAAVDRAERRLVHRDANAEERARAALAGAGVRRATEEDLDAPFRLPAARLLDAAAELLEKGWRIEIEGELYVAAGQLTVAVSTGMDWLGVETRACFGQTQVPFPELLVALKQGRRTVLLADGSRGVLPMAWMDRLRLWARLGRPVEDGFRFEHAEVGIVVALVAQEENVEEDPPFAALRAEMTRFEGIAPQEAPAGFRGELRDYQQKALGWFAFLRKFRLGGCLADDMGLGKTVQILALLLHRRIEWLGEAREGARPSLVVVPRSLLHNWRSEATRFAPELSVFAHDGPERLPPGAHFARHDVVLTTYGLLRRDANHFNMVEFDHVIFDEAQAIKNGLSASACAAQRVRARHRLALSGTPLENHLGDLASLFDTLNPGVRGASVALSALEGGRRTLDPGAAGVLSRALRPFFLRRTKSEVARELPERIEQTIFCELERPQRRLYDQLLEHFRSLVAKRPGQPATLAYPGVLFQALMRLRQAACHPGLVDRGRRKESSAKVDVLLAQLGALRDEGRKALVFSQFTSFLDIVENRLIDAEISYERLDGQTTNREAKVERFQKDDKCAVFLISLKAGGFGLNLTAADTVIILDPWWNPAAEAQAIDRAHRIGQTKTVFAYRLIAKDTIEEKVEELKKTKRALCESLFGDFPAMTREDLELLLS